MNTMFELHTQKEKNGEVKIFEVFAQSFDEACTKYLNKYPDIYKITNPCIYHGNGVVI